MKAKAIIQRTYVKEVEVEFELEPGSDVIEEAYDKVLYTSKVEELFHTAQLREVDDVVKEVTWEEASGFMKEIAKYS